MTQPNILLSFPEYNQISQTEVFNDKRAMIVLKQLIASGATFVGAGNNGVVYQLPDSEELIKITSYPVEIRIVRDVLSKRKDLNYILPRRNFRKVSSEAASFTMDRCDPLPSKFYNALRIVNNDLYWFFRGKDNDVVDKIKELELREFIINLYQEGEKLGIRDRLDVAADNIMMKDGKLVLVDI